MPAAVASAARRPSRERAPPVRLVLVGLVELRRDGRVCLRDRVCDVTEDVRRIVELHELLGRRELAPLALVALRLDLRADLAGAGQGEALVVVVDDDQVAQLLGEAPGRVLELLDQACLGQLAPLLERECKVVELVGSRGLVVGIQRLAGRPVVGSSGIGGIRLRRDCLLRADPRGR